MTGSLEIRVYGTPAPQGSKNKGRYGNMYDASKKLKPWRDAVANATLNARTRKYAIPVFTGPIRVDICFLLQRPKSVKKNALPCLRFDLDKLTRAVNDGIVSGGAIEDDSRIVEGWYQKRYVDSEPGARIVITRVLA